MRNKRLVLVILLGLLLRFYHLPSNPPSLYWDEASLGYNAYSILKTARDEHDKFLPLTNFGAFGDYKPPGYIYMTVPSIAIFGLTEFAVRFPSAFFGILTVVTTYFLAKKLFKNETIALITAFFLAISPWHLQFSRVAFEANLALFFSTAAILFFIWSQESKKLWIYPSLIFFIAAMYTFTGQRLFVPFMLLLLFIFFRRSLIKTWKYTLSALLLFLVLFFPLYNFATRTIEGKLRFEEVTIFKDLKPINDSIQYRQAENFSLMANIIHNRRLFFAHEYLSHYLDAFNPAFLFFRGDQNPRLSIQHVGELYYFDIIIIFCGIYFLVKRKEKYAPIILGWLLISPLSPATARETPHALRMVHILPTFQLIGAYGLYNLIQIIPYKKISLFIAGAAILASIFYYLHFYYAHYPKEFSGEWQYGYREAVNYVKTAGIDADQIAISSYLGRPYIYFLFYNKVDPASFQKNAIVTRDNFFFYNVEEYKNMIFLSPKSKIIDKGRIIFVSQPGTLPANAQKLKTIEDLSGHAVFEIGRVTR